MFPATRTVPVDLNLVPFVNDVINALPGPLHRIAIRHRELIKFAIVGGAVPWLLLDNQDMPHVGTLDVDLGLSLIHI